MLLSKKVAVVYGAGGAVGGTIARAFAREGASVFLTGRSLATVSALANEIGDAGGVAAAAKVDALDEIAIDRHLSEIVGEAGRIDISFNAIGIRQHVMQGVPLIDISLDSFALPISTYLKSHFLTARTAIRQMLKQKSGVILMHTPEPARLAAPHMGGMAPAWAGMESLSRDLSAEYGAQGIRTVCLRSTGLPETATIDLVFDLHAKAMGISRDQFRAFMEGMSHTRRSATLKELGDAAVFAASDQASGITGAILNLTGGKIAD
jgi:NAD(P)-dependent dehydrogenase (short-subunit alcohol dehydrogenase family)